ncbi:MAG: PHP domain-containing protein [Acidimicrobiales bacterium]
MTANPFDLPGVWLKAALHTHTTESDGDLSPRALAMQYGGAGFDVLAITDHWRLTHVPSTPSLLLVPGAELTFDLPDGMTPDLLVYGISEIPEDPGGDRSHWMFNEEEHWEQRTFPDLTTAAAWVGAQGGACYVAHPYWTGMGPAPLLGAEGVHGLEVYNASAETECGRGDSSMVWDAALEAGRALSAIATDDTHYPLFDIGHAWTMVRAADPSPEAVVHALREGHSYCSAGPLLHAVHRDGGRVEVACSPCRALIVVMPKEYGCAVTAGRRGRRWGRILATSESGLITRAVIECPWPEAAYLRLKAVDAEGYAAWTNPL